ncbi:indolepyruvate ferredoxin oxidoreductase family protein [Bradyrhizobium sp. Ai1a-2]|uniref:indolepyruvate ferredoxin oxidoreductase family protein n=1 Tax=Bradyrhizobium sp. Ai1a-2 TaxID=196490 RepID=UPI0003F777E8|nr:indolepyruvate ferredoxin oxidoreductase family protein [Bradyrhizobium sp. Ai1a-2]
MSVMEVGLDDKYRLDVKRIFLSGTQALVRLPMLQRERDRAQGLTTAGFISGYRGSPLGMYDHTLWRAKSFLKQHDIAFVPGLNEDLAATAVWGSQQVGMFPGAKVDGVFGIWYGKGPGVDRSLDALKHANSAGTSRNGGVIALAGDDHGCQSSTLAHQSEQVFAAALMPVVNPATLQDYLDLGILGFALSRYSGCWIGFKAISETVESSASIISDPDRIRIVTPDDFEMPPDGLSIRWPDAPLEQERRLHGPKMQAVAAFARANRFDRIVLDSRPARLGIMATGKAYLDLRQALAELGISDAEAQALGLRIYKVALTWPLEESGARAFAEGLQDVLVVEEKRGFIEEQLVRILYNVDASKRPSVVGKRDESGAVLLPSEGELTPTMVAAAVVARLRKLGHRSPMLEQRLAKLEAFDRPAEGIGEAKLQRTPYFCSGCPHNTSTKIPEGSRAMAGIGCHGMALSIPARRTATISHMGAEGVAWIGQAPFTDEKHVFQNLGDGTYTHSGLLALRAAAAAGVNITYKILYNDAVAMTGGQPAEGSFTVSQIAHQVAAEGTKRIAIVSDDPTKYPANYFPTGATIHHRRELDAVQRELRDVAGLTVLIYDQTCAAEKRRRRKRGLYPDPPKRVFINERVCEGCGDCSVQSNCVSVQPLETELGRKRRIDQSNCNKDFSCIEGFCPSFVTVHDPKLRKADRAATDPSALFADLPTPQPQVLSGPYNILVTGIGGTGVITIGALLGMAAHVEGLACSTLDFTGLSQKNGAVMSHVRLAPRAEDLASVRIAAGGANLILGCDIVVATSVAALSRAERGVTRAIVNADLLPTASFVMNPDLDFEAGAMRDALSEAVTSSDLDILDATGLATALMGDSIATNAFLLGFAFQSGAVPMSLEVLMKAIELNGAAVDMNKMAFSWGRLAAHDLARVVTAARFKTSSASPARRTLDEIIAFRAKFLTDYQDEAYSQRYLADVARVRAAETAAAPGSHELTEAFAKGLFKLMAYKDEYEVARLYTDGEFAKALKEQFDGESGLKVLLAPPLFARRDKVTGHLQKREFGPWVFSAFKLLTRLKGLRGTALDIFGYTAERRMERALPGEYSAMILRQLDKKPLDVPRLVALAKAAELVRGYGHIKEANVARYRQECQRLEAALQAPVAQAAE